MRQEEALLSNVNSSEPPGKFSPLVADKLEKTFGLKLPQAAVGSSTAKPEDAQGKAPTWQEVGGDVHIPPEPIDGPSLVSAIEGFYNRFMVLPEGSALALAIWTIGTHAFNTFDIFPYLVLLSAVKRCGKTRLTKLLAYLCAKSRRTINMSEAALFRLVDSEAPTLILDEAEYLKGKTERAEAISALLNAGYERGADVPRCNGKDHELKFFSVYSPKIVACIGHCPDTLRDRSILFWMERRSPDEKVERLLSHRVKPEAEFLKQKIAEWVSENLAGIEEEYEKVDVLFLEDREADIFEPLFAILQVANPSRWDELKAVAQGVAAKKAEADEDESRGIQLLSDIRKIMASKNGEEVTSIATQELLDGLKAMQESPWSEAKRELNPMRLAKMLKLFGVRTQQIWNESHNLRGYDVGGLKNAFSRYLP